MEKLIGSLKDEIQALFKRMKRKENKQKHREERIKYIQNCESI
jgi:hypothetical protein